MEHKGPLRFWRGADKEARGAERPQVRADEPELRRGPATGAELGDVRSLQRPFQPDAFGRLRPPVDRDALRLSLELANMTYYLELEDWVRAGWRDVSIQIDDQLQSGVTSARSESGAEMADTLSAWKLGRAKYALREPNPIAQIFSAIRQREGSDTIKAVTMLHPAPDGRYVVAIGFMGTGSRFYDWFSNFRFTAEEGFHKGFYQLANYFEQSAERIEFPDTAAQLGLERLTLAQVLEEMKSPDSRFTLWMAGHSQGGAVMQVFCHKLLHDWGVLPAHVVGYGFASPTVASRRFSGDPAAYPLYHLLNTDDLVPRMGALTHLGLCLEYQANDRMRSIAYGWSDSPEAKEARTAAHALSRHMEDTPSVLESGVALCATALEEKSEENLNALTSRWWSIAPIDRALTFTGEKARSLAERVERYAELGYRSLMGEKMDPARVEELKEQMRPTVRELPLRKLLGGMKNAFYPPHTILREHGRFLGAYGYIAQHGLELLRPFLWEVTQAGLPVKRYADTVDWAKPLPRHIVRVRGKAAPALRITRRSAPQRRPARHSARTRGVSQLRRQRAARKEGKRR